MPGPARRIAAAVAQETLDRPVFQTVKTHHRKPPAGLQHALRRAQALVQFLKLAVHMDADRLEGAGRRVLGFARTIAGRTPDDRGQFARPRSEEHPSELTSLMRTSYALF